ncbi:hypothetical protein G6F65_021618 [Rhizopus arrhizus]|nr:hypothetical protein G6F65_021618 [Rhizopus arrhizus]
MARGTPEACLDQLLRTCARDHRHFLDNAHRLRALTRPELSNIDHSTSTGSLAGADRCRRARGVQALVEDRWGPRHDHAARLRRRVEHEFPEHRHRLHPAQAI